MFVCSENHSFSRLIAVLEATGTQDSKKTGVSNKLNTKIKNIFRGGSRGDQSDHATKVKIGQKIGKLKCQSSH